MDIVCFSCKRRIPQGSLKTSRSRFKQMGITPPMGMGISDKICSKCLNEMYEKQVKQSNLKKLKEDMEKDLRNNKKSDLTPLPKKIGLEKKKKVFKQDRF